MAIDQPSPLQRYNYYLGPRALADVWTLRRGALIMRCGLTTHSLGWELRLTSGQNFLRSQVCKSEAEVFSVSDAWAVEAKSKGWGKA